MLFDFQLVQKFQLLKNSFKMCLKLLIVFDFDIYFAKITMAD